MSEQMSALQLQGPGQGPVGIRCALPEPGPGQVRVRLRAAAMNRRDHWIVRGLYPGIRYPTILGSDGAGVVEALGEGVAPRWRGAQVVIDPSLDWGLEEAAPGPNYRILGLPDAGTFAQAVVVPAQNLHEAPAHLDWVQRAALPLAGLTAWRALVSRGRVRAGERVLITGAGGGVASFLLRFAVALDLRVDVTSSDAEVRAGALALGAQRAVDYRAQDWPKLLAERGKDAYDLIIDSAGGADFAQLVRLLAPGGRIVFFGGTAGSWPQINPAHLFFKQASLLGSTMGSPRDFVGMLDFVQAHRLTPQIDRTFTLAEGAQAFEHLAKGRQSGKIVFDLAGE